MRPEARPMKFRNGRVHLYMKNKVDNDLQTPRILEQCLKHLAIPKQTPTTSCVLVSYFLIHFSIFCFIFLSNFVVHLSFLVGLFFM